MDLSVISRAHYLRKIQISAVLCSALSSSNTCAIQLSRIVEHVFTLSLQMVPQLWKKPCVVPVLKSSRPSDFKHYRPVALTAHLTKTLNRIVHRHLQPLVSSSADSLQYTYRSSIAAEDAVILLMQKSLSHLETAGSALRIMF